MMFGMVFIWLLLLGLGVLVITQLFPGAHRDRTHDVGAVSALEIAARRYAQGEISREQYERIRQDLAGRDED